MRARAIVIAGLLVGVAACGAPESSREEGRSEAAAPAAADREPTGGEAAASTGARALDPRWYEDDDGNGIPNFVETGAGFNPAQDDCAIQACTGPSDGREMATRRATLLMLDSSGSMVASAGGQTKMEAAKASLSRYVGLVSDRMQLGFLVYGHRGNNQPSGKAASCVGIDVLAPIGSLDRRSVGPILARFQPTGWTPIAAALEEASRAFRGREGGENRILLVSDGLETCGGDPAAVARRLHESGLELRIDVVGFGVGSRDAEQLRRVAEAGGGRYADVRSRSELDAYLADQVGVIAENAKSMRCEFSSGVGGGICDSRLGLAAGTAFREARQGATPAQLSELDRLQAQVDRYRASRDAQRAQARDRLGQSRDAYERSRGELSNTLEGHRW